MVRFNANLSSSSLESLIKQLNTHGKKLVEAQRDVLQALADYVYDRIMFYVPVDTGRLKSSFEKEVSNEIAKVYTDLFYAKYVEFGTGIRGKSENNQEGKYDTKYTDIKSLTYNESYQGQPARKFIYKAVQDLEQNYVEIAKNVLRKKGLI